MPNLGGAVDLGALKNKPQPAAPEITPPTDEEIDALAALGEDVPEEDEREVVTTAFLVFQTREGQWQAHADLDVLENIRPERQASGDDFIGAAAAITKDVTAMETASHVFAQMQAQAQMAMRAQQEAVARQQVAGLKNLRG